MAQTEFSSITQPNYNRVGINATGTDIPKRRFVKWSTTYQAVALASAATDAIAGVTTEIIYNGNQQSFQVDGRAVVEAGGAIAIGQQVTADSVGRAVVVSQSAAALQTVGGTACTAASAQGDFIEIELKQLGGLLSSFSDVATIAALKAVDANSRFDGMMMTVLSNNSLWRFNASAVGTGDAAGELLVTPTAGTGRWVRADKSFVLKVAVDYTVADAALIETIPAGFVVRIAGFPHWDVATGFTGGTSSAIGVSSDVTGFTTKGDIVGGAAGDVAATLVAGITGGTVGGKLDTLAHMQAGLLVAGKSLRFDRITSAFTAGAANFCLPVFVAATP